MNEKRSAVFTIAVISAIILIFTAADLIQGDRLFSQTENRVLASRPKFSAEALLTGKYTSDYETYVTDQFVSRDKWISVKTWTDMALGQEEINGVYLGKDGYLIEQHLPEDYSRESAEEKLALLQRLVERWDAKVMLVPTADNILEEKLPAHAPRYDETWLLDRAAEIAGEDRYLDVYAALCEHKEEPIYYRTDHHWTSLGAYYGYLVWEETWQREREAEWEDEKIRREQEKAAGKKERYREKDSRSVVAEDNAAGSNVVEGNAVGSNAAGSNVVEGNAVGSNTVGSIVSGSNAAGSNVVGNNAAGSNAGRRMSADERDAEAGKGDRYGRENLVTVTEDFLGTLHSKVNLSVRPDSIQYFPGTLDRPVKVTYDLRTKKDTCYEESYLDTKNQYGFFLDDNHAIVEIETEYHNGKTLFVIKDSYANCFVPMLIPYYERIYVMDLRYFNGRLFPYMESCRPEEGMDVLVLYNCIHFLEDFSYVE